MPSRSTFTPYRNFVELPVGAHTDGIVVMAFSPCGRYLACGADDNSLSMWGVEKGVLLQKIITQVPVVSLAWNERKTSTMSFFFGCEDGTLSLIEDFKPDIENSAYEVLTDVIDASVDCLDVDGISGYLAIGIGTEVHVAKRITEHTYATFVILPAPETESPCKPDEDNRVRPRSVHFLPGGQKLIVSYLNHGVVYQCWNVTRKQKIWSISPTHETRYIGSTAVSPDFQHILLYNMSSGMHLYKFGSDIPDQHYPVTIDAQTNFPMTVGFVNNGKSVVCGAQDGQVHIWNTATGKQEQVLHHEDSLIQAICTLQTKKYSLIATAAGESEESPTIKIWRAPIPLRTSWRSRALTMMAYISSHQGFSNNLSALGFSILAFLILSIVIIIIFDNQIIFGNLAGDIYSILQAFISQYWTEFRPKLRRLLLKIADLD